MNPNIRKTKRWLVVSFILYVIGAISGCVAMDLSIKEFRMIYQPQFTEQNDVNQDMQRNEKDHEIINTNIKKNLASFLFPLFLTLGLSALVFYQQKLDSIEKEQKNFSHNHGEISNIVITPNLDKPNKPLIVINLPAEQATGIQINIEKTEGENNGT